MAEVESLNEIQKKGRGGARNGAGRPKGSLEPKTIERNAAKDAFMNRVAQNVDRLFNAQFNKALGETYLMVVKTTKRGKDTKRETMVVTDVEIIKQYLNEELDNTDEEYYFMSTKPADNTAISDLLNRSFGKPTEKTEIDGKMELVQPILGGKAKEVTDDSEDS